MDVAGKVIVVTGGGAGIGREVVDQLTVKGAEVHVLDLRVDEVAASGMVVPHRVDISDGPAVAALAASIGEVDAVVNVAGIVQDFVDLNEMTDDQVRHVMDVNFWGTANVTRAFLPSLLRRSEAAVVNVSSMGALVPVPGQSAYGASKAAVKLFTEGLRAELRGTRVTVSVVFPGGVNTDITTNSGVRSAAEDSFSPALQRTARRLLTQPRTAAARIVRAVEKGTPRVVVGKDARLVDLMTRVMPARAASLVAALMGKLVR
jgi:NAD(P)-dependent dehydrogenase (short-subunit alcohol dehydrogenase family)